MTRRLTIEFASPRTMLLGALCAILASGPSLGGPRSVGLGGNEPKSPPARKPTGENDPMGRGGAKESGRPKGMIQSYVPANDSSGEDDTLVGTLTFKPDEKDAKVLKLRVHRGFDVKIGDVPVDSEAALELLWKGLYATAAWGFEPTDETKKKAAPQKELRSLVIDTVEVEGSIEEVGDDFIVIKAKPIKGDWPDDLAKASSAKQTLVPSAKSVKPRVLRLKTVEKVSKYFNKDLRPADPSEFSTGQKIESVAGYGKGKTLGILISLRPPTPKNLGEGDKPPTGRRTPTPPPRKGASRPGG